ncbi:MAG TPA: hypothetical protein DDY31_02320 [Lachnospiraceae bacterium]|nr:hypothetical protein [Lachnospiraceae bacterium]
MAKLIFTSHYMKGALPAHLQHYVKYIATREGVEQLDDTKELLSATENQKKLIQRLVKDFPESKKLLEYEDYLAHDTRRNASAFIQQVMDSYVALSEKRENYVDYIGSRPGVEHISGHGLFTDAGVPVVLSQVQQEVANHKGAVWTHVVSLRREDAIRLGYDNGKAWQALLRSKRAMFCKEMKIDSKNLKWYAAFHNESHHPHVHIMVYSKNEKEGYLSKKAIENMRSEFMHDIFRQEFLHIYEAQKVSRDKLMMRTEAVLNRLNNVEGNDYPPQLLEDLQLLSKRLSRTSGKKVYGYLKADVKQLVNRIVDQIAEVDEVKEAYSLWKEWQFAVDEMYGGTQDEIRVLSSEKKLKRVKNLVIESALVMNHEGGGEPERTGDGVWLRTAQTAAATSAARLLKEISKMFEGELRKPYHQQNSIDRKRRRAIRQKREALGQKSDDTMESQI